MTEQPKKAARPYRSARQQMATDLSTLCNRWAEQARNLTLQWDHFLPEEEPPPPSINTERAAKVMEHLHELLDVMHESAVPIEVRRRYADRILSCMQILETTINESTDE